MAIPSTSPLPTASNMAIAPVAISPKERIALAPADAAGVSSRWGAIQRQARYMFDRDNVSVKVALAPMATYVALKRTPHVPVVATVQARFLLLDYAGWLFADGKRKDGYFYTLSTAEVTLL